MKRRSVAGEKIRELARIRRKFDPESARTKIELVRALRDTPIPSAADLEKYHDALCYLRAFPDSTALFHEAHGSLASFDERVRKLSGLAREALWDTGIGGTPVHYSFSHAVANWLAGNARQAVAIDWDEVGDDTARLDELLLRILLPVEEDFFDSGTVSSREWIDTVSASRSGTDFDWLFAQLRAMRNTAALEQLYDAADLPLRWDLSRSRFSTSRNILPVRKPATRAEPMRKAGRNIKAEIRRPVASLRKLSAGKGKRLIDLAIASLAVRHRETFHFNHANPNEVFIADVGRGISIVVFGLLERFRYPLECTMGFLILSNGVPIGYGGSSVIFRQANTGVNIFDEYRGSEAAFLWVQVMRVYHHLVSCTRFVANPYQFGEDNDEALRSGAYWFYFRLGFRSVAPAIRKLAVREHNKMRRDRNYRSAIGTLRRLATCDMHLTLPEARAGDFFDESGFETASMLASRALGAAIGGTRAEAEWSVARRVCKALGIRNLGGWTKPEQHSFRVLAPILLALDPESWPLAEKRRTRELARAKGGALESHYAKLLSRHEFLLARLRSACR